MTYPFEVCDDIAKICVHKEIFPIETSELVAYIFLPILFAVASVGGVGGGIILVTIAFVCYTSRQKMQ